MTTQATTNWLEERRGFITASVLSDVIAKPTTARYQDLAHRLACEREGALMDDDEAPARSMRFGKHWEDRAVAIYSGEHLESDVAYFGTTNPRFVKWSDHHDIAAFRLAWPGVVADHEHRTQAWRIEAIINGLRWFGASPDAHVNRDGAAEIKLAMSVDVQGQRLSMGRPEKKHDRQCQGILLAGARQWIDFVSFCPQIQPTEDQWFEYRYKRDEAYIAKLILAIADFNAHVEQLRKAA